MINIITNFDSVVVWVSNKAEMLEDGTIQVDDTILSDKGLNIYKVKNENVPTQCVYKYCYNSTDGFYINPNYTVVIDESEIISSLKDLSIERNPSINIDTDICSLDELKKYMVKENGLKCTKIIESGFDIELDDKINHFSMTMQDQNNMDNLYSIIVLKNPDKVPYHADGEPCKFFSREDFIKIYAMYYFHKMFHITYCNALNTIVRNSNNRSEILETVYGIELPEKIKIDFYDKIKYSMNIIDLSSDIVDYLTQNEFKLISQM